MPGQGEHVRQDADLRELHPPGQLDRRVALEAAQVELDRLREARQVVHAQDDVVAELADERQHRRVARADLGEAAQTERRVLLADQDHPPDPLQHRVGVAQLRLDVGDLVAVHRVLVERQVHPLRVGRGEPAVAVGRPLHRRPDAVAVTEPDVVAHADLVAVVEDRRAGQAEQQGGEQLEGVGVVVQQRGQPPADADVGLHAGVLGVLPPHVVALLVGDHLEGQLVVVAQEDAPLAVLRDVRRLGHDLGDREALLPAHGHEQARHDREVEGHLALVAVLAEVLDDVGRPLVGLAEQHAVGIARVDHLAHLLEQLVGPRQVLAVGALLLEQVGHGVEPEAVDPEVQPEPQRVEDRLDHLGVLEVEVGLVGEEPVPEVLLAHRVERPVGALGVDEDDPRVGVAGVVVGPHVEVAVGALRVAAAGLEPGVLVRGVVHDEVDDHAHAAGVGGGQEVLEVLDVAELGQHRGVVADVVPPVAQRGGEERRQPEAVDAEPLEVVELVDHAAQITHAVGVAVGEAADEHLVEDGALVPLGVAARGGEDGGPVAVVGSGRVGDGNGHRRRSSSIRVG